MEFLQGFDLRTIISLGAFTWYLIHNMKTELSARMDKTDARIDKMDQKLTDIDQRVCRMEGALMSKECCMLKDEKHMKRAE